MSWVWVMVISGIAHAIVIDGDISDWNPQNIYSDTVGDGPGEAELLRYGVAVEGGYLNAFVELDKDFSTYDHGTNAMWPGMWIDVDCTSGPISQGWGAWADGAPGETFYGDILIGPSMLNINPVWIVPEWQSSGHYGIDIVAEWQLNEGYWPYWPSYYFMGREDIVGRMGSTIQNGQRAYQGRIAEFSCRISEILAEVETYPDYLNGTCLPTNTWRVGIRAEGCIDGQGWGLDGGIPITVTVPEPATASILALSGLALLRRRKA